MRRLNPEHILGVIDALEGESFLTIEQIVKRTTFSDQDVRDVIHQLGCSGQVGVSYEGSSPEVKVWLTENPAASGRGLNTPRSASTSSPTRTNARVRRVDARRLRHSDVCSDKSTDGK